jgi:hypothetical protein
MINRIITHTLLHTLSRHIINSMSMLSTERNARECKAHTKPSCCRGGMLPHNYFTQLKVFSRQIGLEQKERAKLFAIR